MFFGLLFNLYKIKVLILQCVKSVRIWSNSGAHFTTFGLNTERYSVSLRIQPECGKIRIRITPNTDTFYGVFIILKSSVIPSKQKLVSS